MMNFGRANIAGRPLTDDERRLSQKWYMRFCAVNGVGYSCLGENVMVLFAAGIGAPNYVVAMLGTMLYAGYALLPLGVWRTARVGASASQADFWTMRNIAALFSASAALVSTVSPPASWALLVASAFIFYGCRAAGTVLGTPLIGDISTEEEAPGVIGRSQALFNSAAVATLAAITAVTTHWRGTGAIAAIIVTGACLDVVSAWILRGVRETGAIRDAARAPLWAGMRSIMRGRDIRRFAAAWSLLNLSCMTILPMSMLALKRGCGLDSAQALACAFSEFLSGSLFSLASGPLCRKYGPRQVLIATGAGFLAVPAFWLAAPARGHAALAFGLALFFWLGIFYNLLANAAGSYFLLACPEKGDQVPGSVAVNLVAGAGAGAAGSIIGAWLVTFAARISPRFGGMFAGSLGTYRLYFLLLVPVALAALASSFRMRRFVYHRRSR